MIPAEIAKSLTPAQVTRLRLIARIDGGRRSPDGVQSLERLYNLGLVARIRNYTWSDPRWPVTDAGRAVLAALDQTERSE